MILETFNAAIIHRKKMAFQSPARLQVLSRHLWHAVFRAMVTCLESTPLCDRPKRSGSRDVDAGEAVRGCPSMTSRRCKSSALQRHNCLRSANVPSSAPGFGSLLCRQTDLNLPVKTGFETGDGQTHRPSDHGCCKGACPYIFGKPGIPLEGDKLPGLRRRDTATLGLFPGQTH